MCISLYCNHCHLVYICSVSSYSFPPFSSFSVLFFSTSSPLPPSPSPPQTHTTFMTVWNIRLQQKTEGHISLSNSLFVVWFSFSPDRITPTLWRQWPASNSCWRKCSLDSEINFPASHVNVSLNTFYSPWIPDRRKNMTGSSAAHQCNL